MRVRCAESSELAAILRLDDLCSGARRTARASQPQSREDIDEIAQSNCATARRSIARSSSFGMRSRRLRVVLVEGVEPHRVVAADAVVQRLDRRSEVRDVV